MGLAYREGRGSCFLDGQGADAPLQMGTLSKATAVMAAISAPLEGHRFFEDPRAHVDFSTGLPPASAAAAIVALDIIESEPELIAAPLAERAPSPAARLPEAQSPIVPLVLGEAERAGGNAMSKTKAFWSSPFVHRPCPGGTARLRFAFAAAHKDGDIDRLAALVAARVPFRKETAACLPFS